MMRLPPLLRSSAVRVTSSSSGRPASMTTSAVISLLMEAIGMAMPERREYSTESCVVSSTSAALERSAGSASEARPAYLRCVCTTMPCGTAAKATGAESTRQAVAVSLKKRPGFIVVGPAP